ncbi:MAG: pyridoxamine 5'-phosphate oxidase [Thermoanaerobaculia bacterium]
MSATPDPIARFQSVFERAKKSEPADPTNVTLATADAEGRPSARMVLLKQVDQRGFVFYTNRESRKALELAANPHAALCFYWPSINQQVRVEGPVEPVSDEEADAYFATRTRGSQLGAWASHQSRPLESRIALVGGYLKYKARFAGRPVPRPPYWGGYRLIPEQIEFWQHQRSRLHDRTLYTRTDAGWNAQRLYP